MKIKVIKRRKIKRKRIRKARIKRRMLRILRQHLQLQSNPRKRRIRRERGQQRK